MESFMIIQNHSESFRIIQNYFVIIFEIHSVTLFFGVRSEYPGWDYKLWGDAEAGELKMRNQDLYDEERMYQCKVMH